MRKNIKKIFGIVCVILAIAMLFPSCKNNSNDNSDDNKALVLEKNDFSVYSIKEYYLENDKMILCLPEFESEKYDCETINYDIYEKTHNYLSHFFGNSDELKFDISFEIKSFSKNRISILYTGEYTKKDSQELKTICYAVNISYNGGKGISFKTSIKQNNELKNHILDSISANYDSEIYDYISNEITSKGVGTLLANDINMYFLDGSEICIIIEVPYDFGDYVIAKTGTSYI